MAVSLHTPESIYSPRHLLSWLLLAFAAGAVNGFGFLAFEQFVTHVTGTATRLGLEWHQVGIAAEYATIYVSFVAGAVVSVVWIQARSHRGKTPRWATPLIYVALILIAVAVAGRANAFTPIGKLVASDPPPFVILSMLAFAMGLQNASVASTTGLAIRTTHLTGPTTDFGIHLGTAITTVGNARLVALKGAALRGGKILAFIGGAVVSVPLTAAFGYLALLAPAAMVLTAAGLSFIPTWSPSDFPIENFKEKLADKQS